MTDMTAEERSAMLHEFFTSLSRKYPGWSGVNIQEFTTIALDQIRQAEEAAAKAAREELLQMPTDSVEDIEAYLESGRQLTGWAKAVWECARRKTLEEVIEILRPIGDMNHALFKLRELRDNPDD